MRVRERTDGNIRSSPTEWPSVEVEPPKIFVWTPTDDSEYWNPCLEGYEPGAAVVDDESSFLLCSDLTDS